MYKKIREEGLLKTTINKYETKSDYMYFMDSRVVIVIEVRYDLVREFKIINRRSDINFFKTFSRNYNGKDYINELIEKVISSLVNDIYKSVYNYFDTNRRIADESTRIILSAYYHQMVELKYKEDNEYITR